MIVLEAKDGIGNQLFQAAFYEELCLIHGRERVELDVSGFQYGIYGRDRPLALKDLGIPFEEAGEDLVRSLRGYSWKKNLPERLRRGLTVRRIRSGKTPSSLYIEKSRSFDPSVLLPGLDQVYLSGYWQDERYFPRGGAMLRRRIRLPEGGLDPQTKRLLCRIRGTNSVSVHIRRGDYLEKTRRYGGICTEGYYQRAIAYMRALIPDPLFFLFSDDPDYLRGLEEEVGGESQAGPGSLSGLPFQGGDMVPVTGSRSALTDLLLMSACRHSIIANSTFSWWGAVLGREEGRIVAAPDRWYGDGEKSGIVRETWHRIQAG